MRKTAILLVVSSVVALILWLFAGPKVCIGVECIPVELALTQAEQEKGLMGRTGLDGGMLFVFPKADIYGFWMQNMDFPIDIVWISAEKKVVDISRNVPPCADACILYYPPSPVRYVLEVPANFSLEKGILPGDRVVFWDID